MVQVLCPLFIRVERLWGRVSTIYFVFMLEVIKCGEEIQGMVAQDLTDVTAAMVAMEVAMAVVLAVASAVALVVALVAAFEVLIVLVTFLEVLAVLQEVSAA